MLTKQTYRAIVYHNTGTSEKKVKGNLLCKQGAACRVATFKLSMRVMKKMDFQKVASKVFKRTKEVKTGLDARAFPIPDKC